MRDSNRALDVVLAVLCLLVAAPLLLVLMALVRLDGPGPVLLAQERVGRNGRRFRLHKLRTLRAGSETEGRRAPAGDPRITRAGRWLRRTRLDELPQVFDVLRGAMAMVGPRPELAEALAAVPPADLAAWLSVRPGWTGPTQLAFLAEDAVLDEVTEPDATYRDVLVPHKVASDLDWLARRTLRSDLWVLAQTPWRLLSRRAWARSRRRVAALLAG